MSKSTLPFLLINLGILFFFGSCGTNNVTKGFEKIRVENEVYPVPFFSNPETDYVYKANISAYGHELSGILIIKKTNATTHRLVFTTEFGNKLLDFEISETNLTVKSIVDELDRKIIINTLANDFRLLLKENHSIQEQYNSNEENILSSKDKKNTNFIFVSKTTHAITKLTNATKRKQKLNIFFSTENNTFVNKIVIQHYNLNLKIELNYFEKN